MNNQITNQDEFVLKTSNILNRREDNTNKFKPQAVPASVDKENVPAVEIKTQDSLPLPSISTDQLVGGSAIPTTPVKKFQAREGLLRTPLSGCNKRRNSASPHPHNFLHKVEDPIVQRTDSPLPPPKSTEESQSAIHFNHIVEKEETKFTHSCRIWNGILEDGSAPEHVQGQILSAIGQANLFQNKRFKQFKELIELHKDTTAEKKATEADLAGFWEMIYYQVEDVHKRFSELEKLRLKNWVEEVKCEPVQEPKASSQKAKPKSTTKNPKKPAMSSKFKLFRQQMLEKKGAENTSDGVMIL